MYKLRDANSNDRELLIKYKLSTMYEYAIDISDTEKEKIKNYVYEEIDSDINDYKIVLVEDRVGGAYLVKEFKDGLILDEIFIEETYRNQGIGRNIISSILKNNDIVYLWVYKLNERAIKLYDSLNFKVEEETEIRYLMKYDRSE